MIQRSTTLAPVLVLGFVLALALPCAGNEVRGLPHEKIAKDFLVMHGLADKSPGDVSIDAVLARDFVSTRVGMFEVHFPIAGLEGRSGDLKECLAALLDAQEQILDWSKPAGRDQKVVRADLKTVSGWVKGMRTAGAAKIKDAGGKDLTALLSAPEAVTAAQKRLAEGLGKGEALGLALAPPARLRVLLAPTRREFVELVCFVGWWSEEWKSTYWVDSIADWSTCWMDDVQVIALEYAPGGHAPDDYAAGEALNKRDPKVMEQQLVQLSSYRVFEYLYGERAPVAFLGGLAMNLVIDQFGELNTRVDGDLRGRTAARREVFVAGGASGGGFLAKNSAETRWREDHGKDRFVRVLRLSQKEGDGLDKELKNRLAGPLGRRGRGPRRRRALPRRRGGRGEAPARRLRRRLRRDAARLQVRVHPLAPGQVGQRREGRAGEVRAAAREAGRPERRVRVRVPGRVRGRRAFGSGRGEGEPGGSVPRVALEAEMNRRLGA